MIKLSNLSTLDLTDKLFSHDDICKGNIRLIKEKKLRDYQMLKDYMDAQASLAPEERDFCFSDSLKKKMAYLENKFAVNIQLQPEVYSVPDLISEFGIDREATDKYTRGVLLYGSPASYLMLDFTSNHAKSCDMYTLRELLSHCDCNGENLWISTFMKYNRNPNPELVQTALSMYDEQLVRQYLENKDSLDEIKIKKLMELNLQEKSELVRKQYREALGYLCDMPSFVWSNGSIFDDMDRALLWKAANKNDLKSVNVRNMYINTIASYVTLEEAENGLIKTKALDRFSSKR